MFDFSKINIDNFSYFDEVTSTNDVVLDNIKNKKLDFSCVFAEKQTKGRGRFKRVWQTFPYKSLAFSFNISNFCEVAPLVLCCSIHKVLIEKYKSKVAIKWPNDIYYNNNKLSGILVESFPLSHNKRTYIVGIGLNVFSESVNSNDEIAFLDQSTGIKISREILLNDIMQQIMLDISLLENQGFKQFRNYFLNNCLYLNSQISVNVNDEIKTGEFLGINDKGYLILKQKEVILNINAGQIVQYK